MVLQHVPGDQRHPHGTSARAGGASGPTRAAHLPLGRQLADVEQGHGRQGGSQWRPGLEPGGGDVRGHCGLLRGRSRARGVRSRPLHRGLPRRARHLLRGEGCPGRQRHRDAARQLPPLGHLREYLGRPGRHGVGTRPGAGHRGRGRPALPSLRRHRRQHHRGLHLRARRHAQGRPSLAEAQLGVPVVNSGVSGQGFYEELENLDQEVLSLQGITDCIVLLGTNDLSSLDMAGLQRRMEGLVTRLQPRCRTWVSTLLPKEKSNHGDYEVVKRDRLAFNAWLRTTYNTSLIDLEAVTRQPNNVHLFLDGLEVDGIHPSAKGHQVMATEVARVLRAAGVQPAAGVQVQAPPEEASSDAPPSPSAP
ncbi:SGNH/GDSL hydrolase family protein [Cystobacter fuscus]